MVLIKKKVSDIGTSGSLKFFWRFFKASTALNALQHNLLSDPFLLARRRRSEDIEENGVNGRALLVTVLGHVLLALVNLKFRFHTSFTYL